LALTWDLTLTCTVSPPRPELGPRFVFVPITAFDSPFMTRSDPTTPLYREIAAIALGSNLGDRAAHIAFAIDALRTLPESQLLAVSDIIETAPVGDIPQGPYLNACLTLRTSLEPSVLLQHLHAIERSRGRDRDREQRWGARTLDLDLLLFGERLVSEPGLTVPHPRLHERAFVLEPLVQIAPELPIPGRFGSVLEAMRALGEGKSGIQLPSSGTMPA